MTQTTREYQENNERLNALSRAYNSIKESLFLGKLKFNNISELGEMYNNLYLRGAFTEMDEPIFDTIKIPKGVPLKSKYSFFTSINSIYNRSLNILSNSPGENYLPQTMGFLLKKIQVEIIPVNDNDIDLNIKMIGEDELRITPPKDIIKIASGLLEYTISDRLYYTAPLSHISGSIITPKINIFGTDMVNQYIWGKDFTDIPEFKQYSFINPGRYFYIDIRFQQEEPTILDNDIYVRVNMHGTRFQAY
ncbi:MAG: hypothetical protein ACYC97_05665 [Metallibacterium sp.]